MPTPATFDICVLPGDGIGVEVIAGTLPILERVQRDGIFIEPLPALLLTAPLFLPLAQVFQIDLVHLGVGMTANLAIALYTPPVGGTLFVAAKLAGAGIADITRALIPLMAASVAVLFLVTYWPALTRWLPALLN